MKTNTYVVGFMFDESRDQVVLIRKNKPTFQRGLLNGIGGSVEPGETPPDAIIREFFEETGVETAKGFWKSFCYMAGNNNDNTSFEIEFFWGIGNPSNCQTKTDEKIEIFPIRVITSGCVPTIGNLPWLVALALDCSRGVHPPKFARVEY